MGYKEVNDFSLNFYLGTDREIYEKEVKVLGLLAFENKVKE